MNHDEDEKELTYDEAVDYIATQYGVPKQVYQNLLQMESGGYKNPDSAVSPKGARSRWQMMPKTAKQMNVNLDDPYSAAEGGLRYLRDSYKRFRGKAESDLHGWMMALAAYHAGDGAVAKDLKRGGLGVPSTSDGYLTTEEYVYRIAKNLDPQGFDRDPLRPIETPTQTAEVGSGEAGMVAEAPDMEQGYKEYLAYTQKQDTPEARTEFAEAQKRPDEVSVEAKVNPPSGLPDQYVGYGKQTMMKRGVRLKGGAIQDIEGNVYSIDRDQARLPVGARRMRREDGTTFVLLPDGKMSEEREAYMEPQTYDERTYATGAPVVDGKVSGAMGKVAINSRSLPQGVDASKWAFEYALGLVAADKPMLGITQEDIRGYLAANPKAGLGAEFNPEMIPTLQQGTDPYFDVTVTNDTVNDILRWKGGKGLGGAVASPEQDLGLQMQYEENLAKPNIDQDLQRMKAFAQSNEGFWADILNNRMPTIGDENVARAELQRRIGQGRVASSIASLFSGDDEGVSPSETAKWIGRILTFPLNAPSYLAYEGAPALANILSSATSLTGFGGYHDYSNINPKEYVERQRAKDFENAGRRVKQEIAVYGSARKALAAYKSSDNALGLLGYIVFHELPVEAFRGAIGTFSNLFKLTGILSHIALQPSRGFHLGDLSKNPLYMAGTLMDEAAIRDLGLPAETLTGQVFNGIGQSVTMMGIGAMAGALAKLGAPLASIEALAVDAATANLVAGGKMTLKEALKSPTEAILSKVASSVGIRTPAYQNIESFLTSKAGEKWLAQGVGLSPKGAYWNGALQGIAAQASQAYEEAKNAGLTEEQALTAGFFSAPFGLVEGATDALLAKKLGRLFGAGEEASKGVWKTIKHITKDFSEGFLTEGIEEGVQGAGSAVVSKTLIKDSPMGFLQKLYEKDPETIEGILEDIDDVAWQGLVGGLAGGVMSGAISVASTANSILELAGARAAAQKISQAAGLEHRDILNQLNVVDFKLTEAESKTKTLADLKKAMPNATPAEIEKRASELVETFQGSYRNLQRYTQAADDALQAKAAGQGLVSQLADVAANEGASTAPVAGQQVAGQQVEGQQVAGQQVAGQQVAGQQVAGQQVEGQQVAGQQVAGQQVAGQQVAGQQVAGQQVAGQQVAGQQVAGQQVAGQQVEGAEIASLPERAKALPEDVKQNAEKQVEELFGEQESSSKILPLLSTEERAKFGNKKVTVKAVTLAGATGKARAVSVESHLKKIESKGKAVEELYNCVKSGN